MKIYKVNKILQDKNMQNKECNFKLMGEGRITNRDLLLAIQNLDEKLSSKIKHLEKRIDNLVVKNNLKE